MKTFNCTRNEESEDLEFSNFEVNQLLAQEIIQQRLDIPPTEQNIVQLALYITELEDDYHNGKRLQNKFHLSS